MRFGLTDGQPKTLDEIGKAAGVTRERIRQIESKTMSKLRHPSRDPRCCATTSTDWWRLALGQSGLISRMRSRAGDSRM